MGHDLMTRAELAKRVREERHEQDLTQQEVADAMGKTIQAVSKAENYSPDDGMTGFRLKVLEHITGREMRGPLYEMA